MMSNYSQKIQKLESLISSMDLPELRKTNLSMGHIRWLGRNLLIRNSHHENAAEAMSIIKELVRASYAGVL